MSLYDKNPEYRRNGGAWDRGSADKYYGRPFDPHYFLGGTYTSQRIHLTPGCEAYDAYIEGYNEEQDVKDWG